MIRIWRWKLLSFGGGQDQGQTTARVRAVRQLGLRLDDDQGCGFTTPRIGLGDGQGQTARIELGHGQDQMDKRRLDGVRRRLGLAGYDRVRRRLGHNISFIHSFYGFRMYGELSSFISSCKPYFCPCNIQRLQSSCQSV